MSFCSRICGGKTERKAWSVDGESASLGARFFFCLWTFFKRCGAGRREDEFRVAASSVAWHAISRPFLACNDVIPDFATMHKPLSIAAAKRCTPARDLRMAVPARATGSTASDRKPKNRASSIEQAEHPFGWLYNRTPSAEIVVAHRPAFISALDAWHRMCFRVKKQWSKPAKL